MSKARFIGRHLMVRGKFADAILEGKKKTTIRLGIVKPKYDEVIIHSGGKPIAIAKITNVRHVRFRELTRRDVLNDGFRDINELRKELNKLYGSSIEDDDWVTIIEFEVSKKITELDDPYNGLDPGHLARIALRYLDEVLGEEEKRILRDLTVTNSIRATAKRLYGRWDQRKQIRRTLRRAADLLRKKGVF